MHRRTMLKGTGIAAGGLAAGGIVLTGFSARAAATTDFGSAYVESDDGSVQYVAVYGDSLVEWSGFDTPAQYFSIDIQGTVLDTDGNQLHDWVHLNSTGLVDLDNENWGNYDEELSGSGTSGHIKSAIGLDEDGNHDPTIDWHVVGDDPDGYGLPENSIDPSVLQNETDGSSEYYTVRLNSEYTWYDADENELFAEDWNSNATVEVVNKPRNASVEDGDGEDGAVAE